MKKSFLLVCMIMILVMACQNNVSVVDSDSLTNPSTETVIRETYTPSPVPVSPTATQTLVPTEIPFPTSTPTEPAPTIDPNMPFPGVKPDASLAYTNNAYAQVVTDFAPVYASLEDAVAGKPVLEKMEPGFEYVTYLDTVVVDEARYYMVEYGRWMTANDLSRVSGASTFQGFEFSQPPIRPFGWVLFERQSKATPGFAVKDETGFNYVRYQVVEIFEVAEIDGADWYLVAPDEWLEGRLVAGVFPNTTPPEGVENGRWIEVNLEQQTAVVYEDAELVFATVIASGVPGQWTQPGLFQAYKKVADETMSGSFTADRSDYYYLEGVPWTVYFDQARAFHGTYWHNAFGVPQSRGCVNLSTGDSHWVFDWIQEGDWIYVWDPSGETPTDPSLFGSGGA
jgi:hypothetical protein